MGKGQKPDSHGRICFNINCDESLDRPTLRDGIWWNPIVQSYSRELSKVYRKFADEHSLLIAIERPSLTEALAVRRGL